MKRAFLSMFGWVRQHRPRKSKSDDNRTIVTPRSGPTITARLQRLLALLLLFGMSITLDLPVPSYAQDPGIPSEEEFGEGPGGAGDFTGLPVLAGEFSETALSKNLKNHKLNGDITRHVNYPMLSPDGVFVVYEADDDTPNHEGYGVYSARVDGQGSPVRLSEPFTPPGSGNEIYDWGISPDSARVVYMVKKQSTGVYELYSVPIGGGSRVKLNGALVSGGNVSSFLISPNSAWVVYAADQGTDEVGELYSAPIAGGTAVKLNGALASGGDVEGYAISPDSTRVIYTADQNTNNVYELFSAPIGGGTAAVRLNSAAGPGDSNYPMGWLISPNSTRVIFGFGTNLYSAPIGGGTAVILSPMGIIGIRNYRISPDSSRVVYITNEIMSHNRLYSVPVGGGTPVELPGPPLIDDDDCMDDPLISPNSVRVVYFADPEQDGIYQVNSVPIGGGTAAILSGPVMCLSSIHLPLLAISPDSARVVYLAMPDAVTNPELFSVPLAGGTPVKLNGPQGSAGNFKISPDSARVVFMWNPLDDFIDELFTIPIGGGAPVRLNGTLTTGGDVYGYYWDISPDSTWVAYMADQETDEVRELYGAPIGGGGAVKMNPTLASGGDVSRMWINSRSNAVVYTADQDLDYYIELYSTTFEWEVYLPLVTHP